MNSIIFPKTHAGQIQKKSDKKTKNLLIVLFISFLIFRNFVLVAQTNEPASPFKVTADLVSHYVWRGSMATGSPTPNFQPTLAYSKGNLEIGVWGSTDFTGSYKEIDPYVTYTAGHIKLALTDYDWNFNHSNYFNYSNSETGHMFEGTIGFIGTDAFPVSVTWNTMFYGFDKKSDDSTKQAFSTYVELGYTKGVATIFLGFTPWSGYYNNYGTTNFDPGTSKKTFSIVNIGASVTKALKITETFSLPLKATLVINPSATYSRNDYIHLIFGITF
jgi:hypothetical protein